MPNRNGFYLRPETPCKHCEHPFAEHDVSMAPVSADRSVAEFEGLTLSFVYCPEAAREAGD